MTIVFKPERARRTASAADRVVLPTPPAPAVMMVRVTIRYSQVRQGVGELERNFTRRQHSHEVRQDNV